MSEPAGWGCHQAGGSGPAAPPALPCAPGRAGEGRGGLAGFLHRTLMMQENESTQVACFRAGVLSTPPCTLTSGSSRSGAKGWSRGLVTRWGCPNRTQYFGLRSLTKSAEQWHLTCTETVPYTLTVVWSDSERSPL